MLPLIGSPPQSVREWLLAYAVDCDNAARYSLLPWNRMKYRASARAFREAARLIAQAEATAPDGVYSADIRDWPGHA